MLRKLKYVVTGLFAFAICCNQIVLSQEKKEHPLVPAIRLAKDSLQRMQLIKDYEAVFNKREVLNGKLVEQQMLMRFREQPLSVYLKFIQPNAGRETLYVQGKNQNQLRVHEGGGVSSLIGTVSLPLDSAMVKAENRHPITQIGLRKMLELIIQRWEYESKYGEIDVKFYPNAKMGKVECEVIEVSHPQPRKQFAFHITRLFIDKKTRLPIRIENYGFPDQPGAKPSILEEYTYTNIKTNVGLPDLAFSEENPQYSF